MAHEESLRCVFCNIVVESGIKECPKCHADLMTSSAARERQFVAHLLHHPDELVLARQELEGADVLHDMPSSLVYDAMVQADDAGLLKTRLTDTGGVIADLGPAIPLVTEEGSGKSAQMAQNAVDVCDEAWEPASAVDVRTRARAINQAELERDIHYAANALLRDPLDTEARAVLMATTKRMADPGNMDLFAYAYLDERYGYLDDYTPPGTIVPGLLYQGQLAILASQPMCGKTGLALHLACCIAMGVPIWEGEPKRDPAHVLYLSYDEDLAQLNRRMMMMSTLANHGDLWRQRVAMFGRDALTPPSVVERYRLGLRGISNLEGALARFKQDEKPIAGVVYDTLAASLDPALDENNNADMTHVLSALQSLCTRADIWVLILHHTRKGVTARKTGDGDMFDDVRGASAILGTPRSAGLLRRDKESQTMRILSYRTNMGSAPGDTVFEVAPENQPGAILYWRPVAQEAAAADVMEYFARDEVISNSDLCRKVFDLEPGDKIAGSKRDKVRELVYVWKKRGMVEQCGGKHPNYKYWCLTAKGKALYDEVEEEGVLENEPESPGEPNPTDFEPAGQAASDTIEC